MLQMYLPGSGVALDMVTAGDTAELSVVVLTRFSEEGDNTRDGVELADYSNIVLGWASDNKYSVPHSWRLLFGAPAPSEMFW